MDAESASGAAMTAAPECSAVPGTTSYALASDADAVSHLRQLESLATGGRSVATAQSADGRLAATIGVDLQIAWQPARLVSLRLPPGSPGRPVFAEATHFAVNLLGDDAAALGRWFAQPGLEKFASIAFEFGHGGAPLLESAIAVVECERTSFVEDEAGTLVAGKPLRVRAAWDLNRSSGEIENV